MTGTVLLLIVPVGDLVMMVVMVEAAAVVAKTATVVAEVAAVAAVAGEMVMDVMVLTILIWSFSDQVRGTRGWIYMSPSLPLALSWHYIEVNKYEKEDRTLNL
jgi:hypothetical protein